MFSPRLHLEPAAVKDAGEMLAAMDPATTRNLVMFQTPVTLKRQRQFLEKVTTGKTDILFIARSVQDGRMIGTIGLHEVDSVHESARMGLLVFRPEDRSQGYGTEMIIQGLYWAFSKCGLHRVYLSVWLENTASRILYSRLGFLQEGIRRGAYKDANGTFHDMVAMAILACEWKQLVADNKLPSCNFLFNRSHS